MAWRNKESIFLFANVAFLGDCDLVERQQWKYWVWGAIRNTHVIMAWCKQTSKSLIFYCECRIMRWRQRIFVYVEAQVLIGWFWYWRFSMISNLFKIKWKKHFIHLYIVKSPMKLINAAQRSNYSFTMQSFNYVYLVSLFYGFSYF